LIKSVRQPITFSVRAFSGIFFFDPRLISLFLLMDPSTPPWMPKDPYNFSDRLLHHCKNEIPTTLFRLPHRSNQLASGRSWADSQDLDSQIVRRRRRLRNRNWFGRRRSTRGNDSFESNWENIEWQEATKVYYHCLGTRRLRVGERFFGKSEQAGSYGRRERTNGPFSNLSTLSWLVSRRQVMTISSIPSIMGIHFLRQTTRSQTL
jgi:hypothetical protein